MSKELYVPEALPEEDEVLIPTDHEAGTGVTELVWML
jgi:hypothetical protein